MHFAVTDFLLDIVQNSCEAGASLIQINIEETETSIAIKVTDNGKGMDETELNKALDPFYTDGVKHPSRKVGLGLPFLKQATEQSNGRFEIRSEKGKGTEVFFQFFKNEIDTPPVGDIPGALISVLCMPGDHEMLISREKREAGIRYELSRQELSGILGSLERMDSLILLRDFVRSQEEQD